MGTPPDLNAQRFLNRGGISSEGMLKITVASGLLSGLAIVLLDDQEKVENQHGVGEQSSTATTGVSLDLKAKSNPDVKPNIRKDIKTDNRIQAPSEGTR